MSKLPPFHGKIPFPAKEKKPTLLTREKSPLWVYGKPPNVDLNWVLASTDRIHVGYDVVPPGGRFEPPDAHAGDEAYYVLKGTLTQLNNETGETHVVRAGEGLFIPKDCWHQGHNFTDEEVVILWAIAPMMFYPDKGPPEKYPGESKLLKAPKSKEGKSGGA